MEGRGLPLESRGTGWLFALFLLLLVWVPVPYGSNRTWSLAVLEIWVFAIAVGWLAGFMRGRFTPGAVFRGAKPVLVCLAVWVAYVWLQLVPLPLGLLQLLSPDAAQMHRAAALQGTTGFAPLTLDRFGTLEGALKSTAYATFFVMSLVLVCTRARVRMTAYAVIVSGILQAVYGTILSFSSVDGLATGTFANRNHYAAYLVMCICVGIGVLIASLSGERNQSWGQFLRGAVEWLITPKMALRLLLVTMVIGLVLTRSRMGMFAFFASLLCAGVIGLAFSKKASRSMIVLLVSLVVIDIFIVGAYFGAERVVARIGQTTMDTEDRDEVARYALRVWKDFPVFGSGLGSFPTVFPRYSGQGTAFAYTHAHNDYVELAAETGVFGIAFLGLIVSMSLLAALRAQQVRRDPVMRGISFASIMSIFALMIHSLVEFNLQIPAIALTFMLLLAFCWISLYGKERY